MLQLKSGPQHHIETSVPDFLLWPEIRHFINNNFKYFPGLEFDAPEKIQYFKRVFEAHDPVVVNAIGREWAFSWAVFACSFDRFYSADLNKYLLQPYSHSFDPLVSWFMFVRSKQAKIPGIERHNPGSRLPETVPDPAIYDFFRAFLSLGIALDEQYVIVWDQSPFSDKQFCNRFMHHVTTVSSNLKTLFTVLHGLRSELAMEMASFASGCHAPTLLGAENYQQTAFPGHEAIIQLLIDKRPGLKKMLRKIFHLPGMDEEVAEQIASLYITPELIWLASNNYPLPTWMYATIAGNPLSVADIPPAPVATNPENAA